VAAIAVEGNDDGVTELILGAHSADPAIARAEFRRVVSAVPPLTAEPDLAAALDTWTGTQDPRVVGGVEVNGVCDVTQCVIYIGLVAGPPQPMRLP
jgi:hypothetical protein